TLYKRPCWRRQMIERHSDKNAREDRRLGELVVEGVRQYLGGLFEGRRRLQALLHARPELGNGRARSLLKLHVCSPFCIDSTTSSPRHVRSIDEAYRPKFQTRYWPRSNLL